MQLRFVPVFEFVWVSSFKKDAANAGYPAPIFLKQNKKAVRLLS